MSHIFEAFPTRANQKCSVNPKGNKAKVEGVKERVTNGKAVRRKSLVARGDDSKSPSEQVYLV